MFPWDPLPETILFGRPLLFAPRAAGRPGGFVQYSVAQNIV